MGRKAREYSADDDKLIRSKRPRQDICDELSISQFTLTKQRRRLGCIVKGKHDAAIALGWGKIPQKILASRLGISISTLQRTAKRLGLKALHVDWTPEKTKWLVSNIETIGKAKAAKYLGCSTRAVSVKLWELGVTEDMQRNELTLEFVAHELLNVSYDTVRRWVKLKLLKTVRKDKRRLVRPKSLRAFILSNAERIDPTKIGDGWDMFIRLVGGQWG